MNHNFLSILILGIFALSQTSANVLPKATPRNCLEIQNSGGQVPGDVQTIYPFGPNGQGVSVRCDFQTEGGAWTIIQSRSPSSGLLDFDQNWTAYDNGFGSVASSNYWVGLKAIYALTSGQGSATQRLRIDLEDWDGQKAYAKYERFSVSSAQDFYRLAVSGYSGNAGDSLQEADIGIANGMQFSTRDSDHDQTWENCAEYWESAWWFNSCYDANLNGRYYQGAQSWDTWGVAWESWKGYRSLKNVQMKIRDASF